jgi:hypothetical protein
MENLELEKVKSPKQIAKDIELAIREINTLKNIAPMLKDMPFFNNDMYNEFGLSLYIQKVCKKYDVSESHIIKVGCFNIDQDEIEGEME